MTGREEVPLPTGMFTKKELTITGSRNSVGMFPESVRLISEGKVNVEALVTKTVSLAELPQTVRDISENPGQYLKVIGILE